MRTRGMILFLLVNIIVTIGVAYLVINFVGAPEQDPSTMPFRTVEVIITATRDPNATPAVRIITATPPEGQIAAIPTGVLDEVTNPDGTRGTNGADGTTDAAATVPTINVDAASLETNPELQGTVSALPTNCTIHSLEEGEFPGLVAEIYGVSVFDILAVNNLTEDDAIFLQIGDPLIIPLEGCALLDQVGENTDTTTDDGSIVTATPEGEVTEPAESATPEATLTPSITPTITLEPTAENAQVEILEVLSAGDVTAEAIVIFNNGRTVDLTDWTLADIDGNVYTFSDQLLFNQGRIEIFTRVGESTTVRKFWGLNEAVWGESGDIVTLRDSEGAVQAIFRLP